MTRERNRSNISINNPEFLPNANFQPSGRGQIAARATFAAEFSAGPIPDPERLARYNEILPGAADRILKMAENQSQHRQRIESQVVTGDINRAYLGVICGLVVTVIAFVLGGYLIIHDHDWAGTTIIITDLAVLVGVFIYGTQTRRQQLQQQQQVNNQLIQPVQSNQGR